MPLLYVKKEVFEWFKEGKKTIDIRRGKSRCGEFAVFQSGANILRFRIAKVETGRFFDVVRSDNYRLIIPSAVKIEDAVGYLQGLFGDLDGFFCAYYIDSTQQV